MNPTSRQPAARRRGVTALMTLLVFMLPLAGLAAPVHGIAFGGYPGVDPGPHTGIHPGIHPGTHPGTEGTAFIRIEQYPSRFEPTLAVPASQLADRAGLAAFAPLRTAGTLLRSAFVDALDPTIGLARPAMHEPSTFVPTRSAPDAQGFGISRDIDGSSAFRLRDSHDRATASAAPVLGVRIGERTSLRLQMGGMDTREEDGFAGGLRFEYVP